MTKYGDLKNNDKKNKEYAKKFSKVEK